MDRYYRRALDSVGRRIFVVSPDLKLLAANRKATSETDPDFHGKKCHKYFYREDTPCSFCPIPEALKSRGQVVRRMLDTDSERKGYHCMQATPVFGGNEIDAITVLDMDVAHMGNLETELTRSNAFLRNLIMSCMDGIVAADMEGRILLFNEAASEISGYTIDEALGELNIRRIYPGDGAWEVMRRLRSEEHGGKGKLKSYEVNCLRKDGTTVPVRLAAAIVYEGDREVASVGFFYDLRERIAGKKRNEELEQRVKERTEELERAYAELKKLNELKDSFLSSVSHELRTPLTSIRSFTEILLRYDDEDPATRKEFMEIIQTESERLTRLINDFLDLSKIEAGKVVYNDDLISLEEIILEVARSQQQVLQQKSVQLNLDIASELPFVFVDRDRMQQVIMNLLNNAVKFSHEGGTIRLRAEVFEGKRSGEASKWIRVSISDEGIGIEEKDFEIIFDKFGQISTDTLKEKPRGTGLGLSICKEIVSHYGGNLWVESQKGKGSTFFFTTPADAISARHIEAVSTDKEDVASRDGKTILVVDDNFHMRKLLRYHFQKRGYNVLGAASGQEAIELAAREDVDLITLDVMMPMMSGYDVLGMLREDPTTGKIPVLIISIVEDKQKGILLGASDHVAKPFRERELMEKVRALLGEKGRSILVVDDEPAILDTLRMQLDEMGYSVEVAPNGEGAIQLMKNRIPDLLILDVVMPGKSGYDVLSWVRKEPSTARLPVILVSAYPLSGRQEEFFKVEADAFVGKSEGLSCLLEKIDSMLRSPID